MAGSFGAMPSLLKLFTVSGLAPLVLLVVSSLPYQTTRVFGRPWSASELWASGVAPVVGLNAAIMTASVVLMLKRSRRGAVLYILGWVVWSLSVIPMAHLANANVGATLPQVGFHLATTAVFGLYLFRSAAVRSYFRGEKVPDGSL